jgi:hypothetical protein
MLTSEELDSLVAPIALYPDPILSQVLVASTYPPEIVEAGRWLNQNSTLKGRPLVEAAARLSDASVQALVLFPDLLKQLNQEITWTSDLGNAFLAQQGRVMDSIQRYIETGLMTKRLALIAWSADYGSTGIMAFRVDKTGIVYQKTSENEQQKSGTHTQPMIRTRLGPLLRCQLKMTGYRRDLVTVKTIHAQNYLL